MRRSVLPDLVLMKEESLAGDRRVGSRLGSDDGVQDHVRR